MSIDEIKTPGMTPDQIRQRDIEEAIDVLRTKPMSDWDDESFDFADDVAKILNSDSFAYKERIVAIRDRYDLRVEQVATWLIDANTTTSIQLSRKLGIGE